MDKIRTIKCGHVNCYIVYGQKGAILVDTGTEKYREYGVNAKVVSLPGHTKRSIGVVVEDKDIIVGDVLMNFFKPQISIIAEDFQLLYESIEKIKSREANIIYVGHGKPILASQIFR